MKLSLLVAGMLVSAGFGILWRGITPPPAVVPEPAGEVAGVSVVEPGETPAIIGAPVRIAIPSISLDAAVVPVGLNADGAMDVPPDPAAAGWYELGPKPGEEGNAVIAGHVDWYGGADSVFKDLRRVTPGDTIIVRDDQGAAAVFRVRELRSFDADADAIDVFRATDGRAHLNLITCEGGWDAQTKQYEKRLVVFADKVSE